MSWFGWGGTTEEKPSSSTNIETPSGAMDLSGGLTFGSTAGSGLSYETTSHDTSSSPFSTPVLALDQIKHAGVPMSRQMSPYLQVSFYNKFFK